MQLPESSKIRETRKLGSNCRWNNRDHRKGGETEIGVS